MIYILIPLLTIIDLSIKYFISTFLNTKIEIFGDLFYFKYVTNPGIAFGIEIQPLFLKILTISLIIFIFYYYIKEEKNKNDKIIDISFSLIIAGAIGNGIERVLNSNVVDYIGVKYFAIFNLADVFITIGAILYIYSLYKNKK